MKSRIINMGDYTMDDQDRALQALLAQAPLPDNGFSEKVMKRVRRRVLLRRLLLPIAVVFGVLVAAGPAMQLVGMVPNMMNVAPGALAALLEAFGPAAQSLASFIPPLAILLVALRLIEE